MDGMVGLDDVFRETRGLLEMEKDIASGGYNHRWPAPGSKPLSGQTVIVGAERMDVPQLFWEFLDVCHINERLEVEQSLGV